MKKYRKLTSSAYTAEVATVSQTIFKASEKYDWSSDSYFISLLHEIETKTYQILEAINRTKTISVLEEEDDIRDSLIRSLYYLNKGYTLYTTKKVVDAALYIKQIIDKYGVGIVEESYAKESAYIESLLNDLNTTEAKNAVSLMPGVSKCITMIKNAQTSFVNKYILYIEAKAQEKDFTNASSIKIELLNLINNKLLTYIGAMEQVRPDLFSNFANTVVKTISDTNTTVKKRKNSNVTSE